MFSAFTKTVHTPNKAAGIKVDGKNRNLETLPQITAQMLALDQQ